MKGEKMIIKTEQNKRLNLKNDIIFKTFFSRKGNEEFLIDFLESLLKIKITKIHIRQEESLEQLAVDEKGGRLDLQAELNDGIIVDIELQLKNNHNMNQRTTFYAAKVLSKETKRGIDYKDIKQVIVINILDYEMLEFEDYISETAIVIDKHREYEVLKEMKWYFIELPKFRRQNPDMEQKINQWIAFIDDNDRGLIKMAEEKNKVLERARTEVNYIAGEADIQRITELREKWEMDRISEVNFAKNEGKEEGKIEGKIEIAKRMIAKKFPLELIIEVTKLSEEQIKEIISNKENT